MQHHLPVGRVERRLKQRAVDGFEEDFGVDALRGGVDKGLAERVNHGADQEVSAQLEGVCLAWLSTDDRDAARQRFEQRASGSNGRFRAGGDDPQAAFLGDVRPAEDRGGHKGLAAPRVFGGQPLTERHADGGERNVQRAGPQRVQYTRGPKARGRSVCGRPTRG